MNLFSGHRLFMRHWFVCKCVCWLVSYTWTRERLTINLGSMQNGFDVVGSTCLPNSKATTTTTIKFMLKSEWDRWEDRWSETPNSNTQFQWGFIHSLLIHSRRWIEVWGELKGEAQLRCLPSNFHFLPFFCPAYTTYCTSLSAQGSWWARQLLAGIH